MDFLDKKIKYPKFFKEVGNYLSHKTGNEDKKFFYNILCYHLGRLAGTMRVNLSTENIGKIPINIYCIALGSSGYGKGHSNYILENIVFKKFETNFLENIFPECLKSGVQQIALKNYKADGITYNDALEQYEKEIQEYGIYKFSFAEATAPGVKQMRNLINIANAGALNISIDEIVANLEKNKELLDLCFELYDQGLVKDKVLKNSFQSKRQKTYEGKSPTNVLMFGTPARLYDGGLVENLFFSMIDSGYARRCLFSYGTKSSNLLKQSAEEFYLNQIDVSRDKMLETWSNHIGSLADISNLNKDIIVPRNIGILLTEYRQFCNKRISVFNKTQIHLSDEMEHRYFKVLKLAGAIAFLNKEDELTEEVLLQAIKLVEDSGEQFKRICTIEPLYIRIAQYILETERVLTQTDLIEAFSAYRGNKQQKDEVIYLAQDWAMKHGGLIKKDHVNNISIYSGEYLKKTDLDKLIISTSKDFAKGFVPSFIKLDQLDKLSKTNDWSFTTHHFINNHRSNEYVLEPFNMIVLDIDGTASIQYVSSIFQDYIYYLYTTKSYKEDNHRFRIIIPINYELSLPSGEYTKFMQNIMDILPFTIDEGSNQISKKWLMNKTKLSVLNYNKNTQLFDVSKYIPNSTQNIDFSKKIAKYKDLSSLEKWFLIRMNEGNRNNMLLRFGFILKDQGHPIETIEDKLLNLNNKLQNSLNKEEIELTIFKTLNKN